MWPDWSANTKWSVRTVVKDLFPECQIGRSSCFTVLTTSMSNVFAFRLHALRRGRLEYVFCEVKKFFTRCRTASSCVQAPSITRGLFKITSCQIVRKTELEWLIVHTSFPHPSSVQNIPEVEKKIKHLLFFLLRDAIIYFTWFCQHDYNTVIMIANRSRFILKLSSGSKVLIYLFHAYFNMLICEKKNIFFLTFLVVSMFEKRVRRPVGSIVERSFLLMVLVVDFDLPARRLGQRVNSQQTDANTNVAALWFIVMNDTYVQTICPRGYDGNFCGWVPVKVTRLVVG